MRPFKNKTIQKFVVRTHMSDEFLKDNTPLQVDKFIQDIREAAEKDVMDKGFIRVRPTIVTRRHPKPWEFKEERETSGEYVQVTVRAIFIGKKKSQPAKENK